MTMKKLLSLVIALAAVLGAQAASLFIDDFSINVNETKTVEVKFDNTGGNGVKVMMFYVYIESNATAYLEFASAPVKAGLTNKSDIIFQVSQPEGTNMYLVSFSSNAPITGSGVVASFKVKCKRSSHIPLVMSVKNVYLDDGSGRPTYLQNTETKVTTLSVDAMITADNMTFTNGQTKKVKFTLNSSTPFSSLFFDLSASNLSIEYSSLALIGNATNTHNLTVNPLNGSVFIYNSTNTPLPLNTPLFEMKITASTIAQEYDYALLMKDINLSDASAIDYYLPDHLFTATKQGYDVNGDGKINVSDVTALINKILGVISK